MEATLDRIERESALLPPTEQAELAASLVRRLGDGAGSLFTSLLATALGPVLRPWLEASAPILAYLLRLRKEGVITEETYMKAGMAWNSIAFGVRGPLPPADVAAGDDGSILFTWDRAEHHLEIEVFPGDAPNEVFYGNRFTDETWSCDLRTLDPLPAAAVKRVKRLVEAKR